MDHSKLDAGLAAAAQDFWTRNWAALERHSRSLGLVTALSDSGRPARVIAHLVVDENADLSELEQKYGAEVNHGTGPDRTALVRLDHLAALSEDPVVRRIEASRRLRPTLDVATRRVNWPQFVNNYQLTGKGVVLGVVDSGIDSMHPAFANRIVKIWDQTLKGQGVAEGRYGKELSGTDLVQSQDVMGHGTHVTGIAAGADVAYPGIAPGATIVMVKTDFQDAHIHDAVRYLYRVAHDLRQPVVVNLSFAEHWGAHDGSDVLSRAIDGQTGEGRIACVSAGNDGDTGIHGVGQAQTGQILAMDFTVNARINGVQPRQMWLNGWYSGADELDVALKSPGDQTDFQIVLIGGSTARPYSLLDAEVMLVTPGPDPHNHDHNFQVIIMPAKGASALTGGAWQLMLNGRQVQHGRVDVWIIGDPDLENGTARFADACLADEITIGYPGVATSAITVASYTTRVQWTDMGGQTQIGRGQNIGTMSTFSGQGPRRDGVAKPDLAAPGAWIVSSRSADAVLKPADIIDKLHRVDAGTSMATPIVSGIVALLLEQDSTLDPPRAKQRLTRASSIPGRAPGASDNQWGYGIIDMSAL